MAFWSRVSSGGDDGSKLGLGAKAESHSGVRGRGNIRMDLGTKGPCPTPADGTGQGVKIRAASQGKEGFFCDKCNSTSTRPACAPTLFPGNHRKQGNSSTPSHHEESLVHAKGLQLEGGKIKL